MNTITNLKESIGHTLFCVVHARRSVSKYPEKRSKSLYITLRAEDAKVLGIEEGDSLDMRILKHQKKSKILSLE